MNTQNKLKYPKGSFINWCEENYKVLENDGDYIGKVRDMEGTIINGFYFDFEGIKSELITDDDKIKEFESCLKKIDELHNNY